MVAGVVRWSAGTKSATELPENSQKKMDCGDPKLGRTYCMSFKEARRPAIGAASEIDFAPVRVRGGRQCEGKVAP